MSLHTLCFNIVLIEHLLLLCTNLRHNGFLYDLFICVGKVCWSCSPQVEPPYEALCEDTISIHCFHFSGAENFPSLVLTDCPSPWNAVLLRGTSSSHCCTVLGTPPLSRGVKSRAQISVGFWSQFLVFW